MDIIHRCTCNDTCYICVHAYMYVNMYMYVCFILTYSNTHMLSFVNGMAHHPGSQATSLDICEVPGNVLPL